MEERRRRVWRVKGGLVSDLVRIGFLDRQDRVVRTVEGDQERLRMEETKLAGVRYKDEGSMETLDPAQIC